MLRKYDKVEKYWKLIDKNFGERIKLIEIDLNSNCKNL
jgi:hypothetical protein